MSAISFSLNGRTAGARAYTRALAKKAEYALPSSNHWSSTEYNSNNAWNVNFNNGNTNNNNKYNNNVVRAVAALTDKEIEGWVEAYQDCIRRKRMTEQCTYFKIDYEVDLLYLAAEAKLRVYKPSTSICFVVTRPKLREIFAADFRDRVLQHWITLRIEPLLEERFISQGDVSFNCRKGYGTLRAVKTLRERIERVSDRYNKRTFVCKRDFTSFFMSINKPKLYELVEPFVREKYKGDDLEQLLYLLRVTIMHCPQNNCMRKGDLSLWDKLPKHKSLFGQSPNVGIPIGNITSQLLANFYLSFFDEYMVQRCREHGYEYIRFVDDYIVIGTDRDAIHSIVNDGIVFAEKELLIKVHPDKVYEQEVRKGVSFIGSVLKPNRTYTSNRTLGNFTNLLSDAESVSKIAFEKPTYRALDILAHIVAGLNSYLGFFIHTNSYNVRDKAFQPLHWFWKTCYVAGGYRTIKIKNKYKLTTYATDRNRETEDGRELHRVRSEKKTNKRVRGRGYRRRRHYIVLMGTGERLSI